MSYSTFSPRASASHPVAAQAKTLGLPPLATPGAPRMLCIPLPDISTTTQQRQPSTTGIPTPSGSPSSSRSTYCARPTMTYAPVTPFPCLPPPAVWYNSLPITIVCNFKTAENEIHFTRRRGNRRLQIFDYFHHTSHNFLLSRPYGGRMMESEAGQNTFRTERCPAV
ncbi:hypothetical protein BU17DRAFT_67881 [Hysterangium stoloniferum]|nr:hypothetical protein BU17DRAFT_67881 [Hysterangium stoloniferum]